MGLQRTPLFDAAKAAGGRMVPFAGWEMAVQFAGLVAEGRTLRRPLAHIAVADHAVPTRMRHLPLPDGLASRQVSRLEDNCKRFGIHYIPMRDDRHGIVHVIDRVILPG